MPKLYYSEPFFKKFFVNRSARLFSIFVCYFEFILIYAIFIVAFLSEKKAVILAINVFGEAYWELVLLTFSLAFISLVLIFNVYWGEL